MRHHLLPLLCLVLVPALALAQHQATPRGKVLVLDSERTIEGEIERVGDRYCVRRSIGETWVPAEKVIRLCADMTEAYRFLAGRCNLDDPDERLKLARWCHLQGLTREALEETRMAVKLRPSHAESKRLLQHFEQMARTASTQSQTATPKPEEPASELPLAVSAEALNLFSTRVQPILMNTCATCHGSDKGLQFQLRRVHEVGWTNHRGTRQNLAAVLGQLDVADPSRSAFLIKAVSAHGPTGQAPLKGRQSAAYRVLEDWVKLTVSHQTPLPDRLGAQAAPLMPPAPPVEKQPAEKETFGAEVQEPRPIVAPAAPEGKSPQGNPKPQRAGTVAAPLPQKEEPEPVDEFDPALFNRHMHPQGPPKN